MAEAVVIPLVETIANALAPEALHQACSPISPVKEAHRRMLRIKSEFAVMQGFLKHADAIKVKNAAACAWVKEVKDMAYQVEDIIDEYAGLMNKRSKTGVTGSLYKILHDTKNAKAWRRIVIQLRDIEAKLLNISDAKNRYGIRTDEGKSSADADERRCQIAESAHFTEDNEIVGIEKNRDMLIGWLTDKDPQRTVISVWGMGGLGKTTLVTNVYNSLKNNHFCCGAWVSVSQNYATNDLLRRIIRELHEEKKKDFLPNNNDIMDHRRLVEALRNCLKNKRYLIVLDDVWNKDVWSNINVAFLDSNCGSRIVITTRAHDVASLAVNSRILKLQPLEGNEAWTLFCKNAFRRETDRNCPQELQYWAQNILDKCEGLPLAIVAIGSLLSLKQSGELAWKRVHDNLSWEMSTENGELNSVSSTILNLSFNDLPHRLKNCFLYCGIFPEDYLIKRNRLIRLWVAEGFIEERQGMKMEETAEDYLDELTHRCMLQVAERNNFGRVKACRMHDLVRDLVVSKSRREKFSVVYDDNSEGKMGDGARHLSLDKRNRVFQLGKGMENLRSFFAFDANIFSSSSAMLQSVLSSFRLLRVLDLRHVPIKRVPNQVFHLFNLRYLGLRQTNIKQIPRSLGRLQNLQTLDLWGTNVEKAPKRITKLKALRHLVVGVILDPTSTTYNPFRGMDAPQGICDLKGLQTLLHVQASTEIIEHVGRLVDMRTFGITKVRYIHGKKLCTSITKMHHLLSLSLVARDEEEALCLKDLYPPPPHLQKLILQCRLEKGMVPNWFLSLRNLMHLELYWSGLSEDPLPALSVLRNLVDLRLLKAYEGEKICFQAGCFPKLKKLFLCNLTQLNWMSIEVGALVSLQELILIRCAELKVAPQGIENLDALEILELVEMPEELKGSLSKLEEIKENHLQIQHIPNIKHWLQTENRWEILP